MAKIGQKLNSLLLAKMPSLQFLPRDGIHYDFLKKRWKKGENWSENKFCILSHPRAGLTWSVKNLTFIRLLQWQNDDIFKHQYILKHKEKNLHSVRNIWTGNVFLQEKPGSHTEHNVVLVDWTHCQVNFLVANFYIVLQIKLSSNQSILACICWVLQSCLDLY